MDSRSWERRSPLPLRPDSARLRAFSALSLRREHKELDVLPLGTGECMNCKPCTYPDKPCRFPELMSSPMEGYGMVISDVCKDNGILYNHGRGTLTYVGCYLFREVKA